VQSGESVKAKRPKKNNVYDYISLKAQFLASNVSIRQFAKDTKTTYGALNAIASREKWIEQKKQLYSKASAENIKSDIEQIFELKQQERQDALALRSAIRARLLHKDVDGTQKVRQDLSAQDIRSLVSADKDLQTILYKSYGIADKLLIGNDPENPFETQVVKLPPKQIE
jgi:hypothetical protein